MERVVGKRLLFSFDYQCVMWVVWLEMEMKCSNVYEF